MVLKAIPLLTSLLVLSGPGARQHPATHTLMNLWEAARQGSTQNFLHFLDAGTAEGVLDICDMYLQDIRSLSELELTLLFALMGLEGSPAEVSNWDRRKVLETILSAPTHSYFFCNTVIEVDSLTEGDSTVTVFFTLHDPFGYDNSMELPILDTGSGWKLAGLDTMLTRVIGSSFHY